VCPGLDGGLIRSIGDVMSSSSGSSTEYTTLLSFVQWEVDSGFTVALFFAGIAKPVAGDSAYHQSKSDFYKSGN
jgi:hypothetical protein